MASQDRAQRAEFLNMLPRHCPSANAPLLQQQGMRQRANGLWKVSLRHPITGQKLVLGSYASTAEAASIRDRALQQIADEYSRHSAAAGFTPQHNAVQQIPAAPVRPPELANAGNIRPSRNSMHDAALHGLGGGNPPQQWMPMHPQQSWASCPHLHHAAPRLDRKRRSHGDNRSEDPIRADRAYRDQSPPLRTLGVGAEPGSRVVGAAPWQSNQAEWQLHPAAAHCAQAACPPTTTSTVASHPSRWVPPSGWAGEQPPCPRLKEGTPGSMSSPQGVAPRMAPSSSVCNSAQSSCDAPAYPRNGEVRFRARDAASSPSLLSGPAGTGRGCSTEDLAGQPSYPSSLQASQHSSQQEAHLRFGSQLSDTPSAAWQQRQHQQRQPFPCGPMEEHAQYYQQHPLQVQQQPLPAGHQDDHAHHYHQHPPPAPQEQQQAAPALPTQQLPARKKKKATQVPSACPPYLPRHPTSSSEGQPGCSYPYPGYGFAPPPFMHPPYMHPGFVPLPPPVKKKKLHKRRQAAAGPAVDLAGHVAALNFAPPDADCGAAGLGPAEGAMDPLAAAMAEVLTAAAARAALPQTSAALLPLPTDEERSYRVSLPAVPTLSSLPGGLSGLDERDLVMFMTECMRFREKNSRAPSVEPLAVSEVSCDVESEAGAPSEAGASTRPTDAANETPDVGECNLDWTQIDSALLGDRLLLAEDPVAGPPDLPTGQEQGLCNTTGAALAEAAGAAFDLSGLAFLDGDGDELFECIGF